MTGGWFADFVWALGLHIGHYSRKQTKREFLQEVATWDRGHIGLGPYNSKCLTCGRLVYDLATTEKCPGPPRTQWARKQLALGKY